MTPPPSEPIRPLGPLAGGVYVDRAAMSERIRRRGRRRERDDSEPREESDAHRDPDTTRRPPTPIRDPRAYDDHGRRPITATSEEPDGPHVDATA